MVVVGIIIHCLPDAPAPVESVRSKKHMLRVRRYYRRLIVLRTFKSLRCAVRSLSTACTVYDFGNVVTIFPLARPYVINAYNNVNDHNILEKKKKPTNTLLHVKVYSLITFRTTNRKFEAHPERKVSYPEHIRRKL